MQAVRSAFLAFVSKKYTELIMQRKFLFFGGLSLSSGHTIFGNEPATASRIWLGRWSACPLPLHYYIDKKIYIDISYICSCFFYPSTSSTTSVRAVVVVIVTHRHTAQYNAVRGRRTGSMSNNSGVEEIPREKIKQAKKVVYQ